MKKFSVILMVAALFAACSDDFLEKEPLDKLSEVAVFGNDKLINQYVVSLYNAIPQPYTEGTIAACTDEAFFRYGGTSTNFILRGDMTPDNVIFIKDGGTMHNSRLLLLCLWQRVFSYVRNMNYFLEKIETSKVVTDELRKQYKGEVLFLRAWTYSNLIQRYGGVPIIKKVYTLGEDYDAVRDKYDDCVNFIIDDLDEAISLLPDKPAVKGRVGADVCRALKARTLLSAASPLFNDPSDPVGSVFKGAYSAEKWKKAADAAKEIIDRADVDGAYELGKTYDDYWTNIDSKEVIWAKFYDAKTNLGAPYSAQLYYAPGSDGFGGWLSCLPTENMVCEYEMAATGLKPFEAGSGYDASKPWAGRDPRFYKSVIYPGDTYEGKVVKICSPAKGNEVITSNEKWFTSGTGGTGYWLRKWLIPGGIISEAEGPTKMYPWFRLAEMYLIYAEASLEYSGAAGVATCAEYINKVRDREDVKMPGVSNSLSVDEMREKVIRERRIELAFENQRYFDLRRWKLTSVYDGIPPYRITGTVDDAGVPTYKIAKQGLNGQPDFSDCEQLVNRTYKPEHDLLPIPRNEYTKSGGMIEQNPGYL